MEVVTRVGNFIVGLYRDQKGDVLWILHQELEAIFTFVGANPNKPWLPVLEFPAALLPLLTRIPLNVVWLTKKPDGSLHLDHETMCLLFSAYQFTSHIFQRPAPGADVVTPMRMKRPIEFSDKMKEVFPLFKVQDNNKRYRAISYMTRGQGQMVQANCAM